MSRNRKPLTLGEKLRIIERREANGATKASIARDLNIPEGQHPTKCGKVRPERKAAKDGKYAAMEKVLVECCVRPAVQELPWMAQFWEKAETVALRRGIDDFKASNGWLDRFKKRSGVVYSHCCGESAEAAVPVDDEPEFGSLELPGSFADYVGADDDVAVCNEVSLDDIIETVRPDTAGTSDEEEMDDAAEASASIGDLLPDVAAIERS
ncbi:hypothetical protein HPB52_003158 [Rhipicephalus sanguineus]|uniref:HTH CENPB-type domain-containing protein n=1 Tax=Rhipicephalus sanguineus TaxID=34632 RepID=A0A9D4STK7_RHISA|nr:hypothetical protein HPB52_003158 [Rhipicephalus sanguineus]